MLCGRYDVTDVSTALKTGVDPGNAGLAGADSPRPGASPRDLSRGGPSRHADRPGHGRRGSGHRPARRHAGGGRLHGRDRRLPGFRGGGRRRPERDLGHHAGLQGRGGRTAGRSGRRRLQPSPSGRRVSARRGVEHRRRLGRRSFPAADLDQLGGQAAALLPTRRLVYPLATTGERFPFAVPAARGFGLADIASPAERFAAGMEGTAQIERLGIERFESLGLRVGQTIFATGGAAASDTWLRIRASVMRRTYAVPGTARMRGRRGGLGRGGLRGRLRPRGPRCWSASAGASSPIRGWPPPTTRSSSSSRRSCSGEDTCEHFQGVRHPRRGGQRARRGDARKIGRALGIVVGRASGDRGFVSASRSQLLGGAIADRGFWEARSRSRLCGGRRVFVAGDFRRSTPALKRALQAGLVESGASRERPRTGAHAGRLFRRRPPGMRQRGDRHGIAQCRAATTA